MEPSYEFQTLSEFLREPFGRSDDMSKIQKLVEISAATKESVKDFSLPMADFRNLLNFRILDALNARGLLKMIR